MHVYACARTHAGAGYEVLELLDRYQIRRAVVHWRAGSPDVLREMVARGFWFTIGPGVREPGPVRDLARALPLAQLLTETDTPAGWESAASVAAGPSHLYEVIKALAQVRETTPEAIEAALLRSFWRLAGDDPRLLEFWRTLGIAD